MGLPKFTVPKMLELEGRLRNQFDSLTHLNAVSLECVGELTDFALAEIKGPFKSRESAAESVKSIILSYLNLPFNRTVRAKLARHIAGWERLIKLGFPYTPWTLLSEPSWACLHVSEVERLCTRKPRYAVTLVSHSGPSVTKVWTKVLPSSYIHGMLRSMGANKFGQYMCEDLYNMWFTAKVHGDKTGLRLTEIHASSSQLKLNKELLKARQGECIGGFVKGKCTICPYGVDKCKLARHRNTYVKAECRNKEPAHTGYIVRHGYCLYCLNKGLYTYVD
jgi:hypothetical protein